jgi:hypothetical protein
LWKKLIVRTPANRKIEKKLKLKLKLKRFCHSTFRTCAIKSDNETKQYKINRINYYENGKVKI